MLYFFLKDVLFCVHIINKDKNSTQDVSSMLNITLNKLSKSQCKWSTTMSYIVTCMKSMNDYILYYTINCSNVFFIVEDHIGTMDVCFSLVFGCTMLGYTFKQFAMCVFVYLCLCPLIKWTQPFCFCFVFFQMFSHLLCVKLKHSQITDIGHRSTVICCTANVL